MKQNKQGWLIGILLVVAAVLIKITLYPHNYSPMLALALFSGSVIKDKKLAFAMPIIAMLLSDFLFEVLNIAKGFYGWDQLVNYGLFILITLIGFSLKKRDALHVASYTIFSTLLFFFLSNTAVWVFDKSYYANDLSGLADSLYRGLPFLRMGLVTDLFYSGAFFGGYALLNKYVWRKVSA